MDAAAVALETNLTCAVTDLISAVILFPMILVLLLKKTDRQKEKKLWLWFLTSLAVSCFLGFFVHNYLREGLYFNLSWIVLYAVLFETVLAFFLLARYLYTDKKGVSEKEKRLLCILTFFVYAVCVIYEEFIASGIRIYAVFALALGVWGFVAVGIHGFRRKIGSEILFASSVLPLLPAAYFQIERKTVIRIILYFNHNGITHLFIIFAIFMLFISGWKQLQKAEKP